MPKIATTPQIEKMIRSRFTELNGKSKLIARLDPDGVHVCSFHFLHERTGMATVRGEWLLKLRGREEPMEVTLESEVGDFNDLKVLAL